MKRKIKGLKKAKVGINAEGKLDVIYLDEDEEGMFFIGGDT
jgi:hypothetical protein